MKTFLSDINIRNILDSINITKKDNIQYSGIGLFVFAVIYYLIQQNSYCNLNKPLCKAPVIVSSGMTETRNYINKSVDTLTQTVKCDVLPDTDVVVFEPSTNTTVGWILLAITVLYALIALNINRDTPHTAFTEISNTIGDKNMTENIFSAVCIFAFIMAITNFASRGVEVLSLNLTLLIIIVTLIFAIWFSPSSATSSEQHIYVILLCIVIILWLYGRKYINKLRFRDLFNEVGIFIVIAVHIIFIFELLATLWGEYDDLTKDLGLFLVYISIVIVSIIQLIMFGSRIYNCYLKTYTCEPEISVKRDSNFMEQYLTCGARLNIGNDTAIFTMLAVAFIILPSEYTVDSIIGAFNWIFSND